MAASRRTGSRWLLYSLAEMGTVVFSTLHTNDAASAPTRLLDMGVEDYLLTSTINAIMAQRLVRTLHPDHRSDWDRDATRRWSDSAEWLGLEIVATEAGETGDELGWVEFVAHFKERGEFKRHQERSRFQRHAGRWYYVDGEVPKPQTQRHAAPRVGRNDPCPCGSGKKFKKCCGA